MKQPTLCGFGKEGMIGYLDLSVKWQESHLIKGGRYRVEMGNLTRGPAL